MCIRDRGCACPRPVSPHTDTEHGQQEDDDGARVKSGGLRRYHNDINRRALSLNRKTKAVVIGTYINRNMYKS